MYFQVTAKCEEVNESSYTRQLADGSQELVEKVQFSLVVPGMRDRVLCEMPKLAAPKPDLLDKWELEEAWIVVSADGIRALGFARTNARAGDPAARSRSSMRRTSSGLVANLTSSGTPASCRRAKSLA